MNLFQTLYWYMGNICNYIVQMLPCMCVALLVFFWLRPYRMKRLSQSNLISGAWREAALLLYFMFVAGLAALTLFPANLWAHVMDYFLCPSQWRQGLHLSGFYPSWEEILTNTDMRNLFTPFQEISRAFRGGPWVMFIMLGNLGIFLPMGFFPALLWRKPRWWKSTLAGCLSSCAIEFIQFFIGRSTDVDDVILNTAGALVGYWLFWLLRALFPRLLAHFHCRPRGGAFLNGLSV